MRIERKRNEFDSGKNERRNRSMSTVGKIFLSVVGGIAVVIAVVYLCAFVTAWI